MTKPLSTDAQAILDAVLAKPSSSYARCRDTAAALRALAQHAGVEYDGARGIDYVVDVEDIYRIADEIDPPILAKQ